MKVKFLNIGKFTAKIESVLGIMTDKAQAGLLDTGNAIMRKSKEQCPHDTGTLMKTGVVNQSLDKRSVMLSYDTPYAVKMHEHPEYNFQKGRKAKYLEDPIKESPSLMRKFIYDKINE